MVVKYHWKKWSVEDVSRLLFKTTKMCLLQFFHKDYAFRSKHVHLSATEGLL